MDSSDAQVRRINFSYLNYLNFPPILMGSSDGAQVKHSLYFLFQNDPFIVIVKISKWIHQTHKSEE